MNFSDKYQKFFTLLFFFPISFIFGTAVAEILAFIYLIYFFLNLNKTKLILNKNIVIIFLFSLYISLNALIQISDDLKYSSLLHLRYIFFSIAILFFFEKFFNQNSNNKLFNYFLIALIILLSDSFLQFYTGKNLFGYEIEAQRISSFFGEELVLGSFLIRTLPILIWYIFNFKIKINEKKLFYTLFFAAYFSVIYLSGGRTSIGLFLIFFILTVLFITDLKKIFINAFGIFLIFVFFTAFFNLGKSTITDRVFKKTYKQIFKIEQFEETKNEKSIYSKKLVKIKIFSEDHNGHLILAKKLFLDNPFFGTGPKGFRHYCRQINYEPDIGICSTHPHNILAQILSELGLIGFIFFVIFFIYIIKKFIGIIYIRNKSLHHKALLVASLGLLINLFPFLPSGNFFNNWISLFIYFNLGLYLFSEKKILSK